MSPTRVALDPTLVGKAIPKGSTVFVTGVNGYIASNIAETLLAAGFNVKGSVRSAEKGDKIAKTLRTLHPNPTTNFEYVVVEDFAVQDAFTSHFEGCTGVVHTASDMSFGTDPNKVITPVVNALTHVLDSAQKAGTVKRFVYTSSSAATCLPKPGVKYHLDSNTWNDEAVELAWDSSEPKNGFVVYAASKTSAERAAWKWMKEHKPSFVLNAVLPNFNIGRILNPELSTSSGGLATTLYNSDNKAAIDRVKAVTPQWLIDVEDDAKLHLAGLAEEDVQSERLLAFSQPFNFNTFVDIYEKIKPGMAAKLGGRDESIKEDISTVDTKRSLELLARYGQKGFVLAEESVRTGLNLN